MNIKYRSPIYHYKFSYTGSITTNIEIILMDNAILNGKQHAHYLADSALILNEM